MIFNGGVGNDRLYVRRLKDANQNELPFNFHVTAYGGENDDRLEAGDAGSTLNGGGGYDTLIGGGGMGRLEWRRRNLQSSR